MKLQPGKYYISRDNHIWCCFELRPQGATHAKAYCIRIADHRVEYFFADGRYDRDGLREHCLIQECSPPLEWL